MQQAMLYMLRFRKLLFFWSKSGARKVVSIKKSVPWLKNPKITAVASCWLNPPALYRTHICTAPVNRMSSALEGK